jgi:hypothetical protein
MIQTSLISMKMRFEIALSAFKPQALRSYCVDGLPKTTQAVFIFPFSDGHTRRVSRLTTGLTKIRARILATKLAEETIGGDL